MIALVVAGIAALTSLAAVFGFGYRRTKLSVVIFTASLAALVIGGLFLVWGQRGLQIHDNYKIWPTAEGRVLSATVIGTRAFRPLVVYEYSFEGITYRDSSSLDPPGFGGRNNKENAARTIAAEYPAGKRLVVHVNPANHASSRLRISPTWDLYGQISVGGLLLAAGLFPLFGRCRKPQ